MNLVRCAKCQILKVKDRAEKYTKGYIYKDANGSLWRGSRCPQCVRVDSAGRSKKSAVVRKCRGCSKVLTSGRYFNCLECNVPGKIIDDAMGLNRVSENYLSTGTGIFHTNGLVRTRKSA